MNFKSRIIKDLYWLINSPGLLSPQENIIPYPQWYQDQLTSFYPILKNLDNNPEFLSRFTDSIKPYVGNYFEKLVALWLTETPQLERLIQHLTVYDNKRTIGEFDFLFYDTSTQSSFHWEVAIKFYLQYKHGDQIEYLGPNAKDSLAKKVNKMLNQQLDLSQNPHASLYLHDYPKPIHPLCLLKGYLFYPSTDDWQNPSAITTKINKDHLRGWWTPYQPLNIPNAKSDSYWLVLNKPFWLSLHLDSSKPNKYLLNFSKLESLLFDHFSHTQSPMLLAEVMQNNLGEWQEISRGFVVSSQWPEPVY